MENKPNWLKEQELREEQQSREKREKIERIFIRSLKAKQKRELQAQKKVELAEIINKYRANIGNIIQYKLGGFVIDVKILNVKQSFGNFRYLITPAIGSGEVWITANT